MELAPRHSVTFFLVIVLPQRSSIRKLGGMANFGRHQVKRGGRRRKKIDDVQYQGYFIRHWIVLYLPYHRVEISWREDNVSSRHHRSSNTRCSFAVVDPSVSLQYL